MTSPAAEPARPGAEGPAQAQAFPNPTRTGQFRLLLPDAFRGQPVAYALVSALGATLARGTLAPPAPGAALPLDLAQAMRATGLYYLLLTGPRAHARLKIVRE